MFALCVAAKEFKGNGTVRVLILLTPIGTMRLKHGCKPLI